MGRRGALWVAVAGLWLMVGAAAARAQSSTDIQLLHGSGYELGPSRLEILTFSHASRWRLGSNFFFFDVKQPFAPGTSLYGEWYSRLSLASMGLTREGGGVIRDLSVTVALNAGRDFRAYLAGATLHLRAPGFTFLNLDLMLYDNRSDGAATFIVTPSWERPFAIGRLHCRFRGFLDYIGAEGARQPQLLTQPQLLVDVGRAVGVEGRLFAGIEYQYWHNKAGIAGVDESLPQLMLLWQL